MRIFAQYRIEAAAAGWRQDFATIMFAYGGNLIGKQYPALEKIQSSKKLDAMEGEISRRQVCKREIESPKTALVSNMMNGQYGLERQPARMHKHRHQRRRPIVCMQNLHLRRQSAR